MNNFENLHYNDKLELWEASKTRTLVHLAAQLFEAVDSQQALMG